MKLNTAAEVYLAMGIDKCPKVRRWAAHALFDLIRWQSETGYFEPFQVLADSISRRWNLGDYRMALSVHFPVRR